MAGQFSSVQSYLTFCDPMDCSTPGFPVHHQLPEFTQTPVHRTVDVIQLFCPLSLSLLLPSIFPSIRIFSNESVLHIRWPKYWSFSFSFSPSNEYSGLISFMIDWFDLLAIQGTLTLPKCHNSRASVLKCNIQNTSNERKIDKFSSVSSVPQSYLSLCDPMDVLHQLPELTQAHVH